MRGKAIVPEGAAPPLAPYSPGMIIGKVLYVGGTLAMDAQGRTVATGDIAGQTRFVLEAIRQVVEAAGGSMKDIAFNHVFIKNLADYGAMNGVYKEFFPDVPPARYCIRADLVKDEFLIEIASIAHIGE